MTCQQIPKPQTLVFGIWNFQPLNHTAQAQKLAPNRRYAGKNRGLAGDLLQTANPKRWRPKPLMVRASGHPEIISKGSCMVT